MNFYTTILLALHGLLLPGLAANAQTPGSTATQTSDFTAAPAPAKDISWYITHCPFPMTAPVAPGFPDRDFPLTDYGAIGDGQTLNTSAFQKAIQACSAAGGGRVVVPPGQ